MTTKMDLQQAVESLREAMVDIATELHDHPEEAFEEHRAAALLTKMIAKHGFDIEAPVASLDTAFIATHRSVSPGATIALLAEYDALPGLGHACGHNLIAGAAFGAAAALGRLKDKFPGRLLLMGTPAEEGGSGKAQMIEAGCFDEVDVALMFHPDCLNVAGETSLAIEELSFKFTGREAHASSCPEKGINALDGVLHTFSAVNALRQHTRDDARIHGIITHGGLRPNIVPGYAEAHFYVRAADSDYLAQLLQQVENCAAAGALASGARLEVVRGHACKELREDKRLVDYWIANMQALGIPLQIRPGKEMGSTDMGDVTHVCRGIHPYLSIVAPGEKVDFHSVELAAAAKTELAFTAMVNAAKLLAMTALDVWNETNGCS